MNACDIAPTAARLPVNYCEFPRADGALPDPGGGRAALEDEGPGALRAPD